MVIPGRDILAARTWLVELGSSPVSDLRKMVLGCIELQATNVVLPSDLYQLAKTHLAG